MSKLYVYSIKATTDNVVKIKGDNIYYFKKSELGEDATVSGITEFKRPKKSDDIVIIDNITYKVRDIKKRDKVSGYFKLEDGTYLAFYKEGIIGLLMILFVWLCLMFSILLPHYMEDDEEAIPELTVDDIQLEFPLPESFVIGGEDGTDVTLVPTSEIEYAKYWGYQSITIVEGMKVPFVNKDFNEHYMVFVVYDKSGNTIETSPYVPPGKHWDWDAYSYYKGVAGEYLHDIKVIWCKPVYNDQGEIVKFQADTFSPRTPDFKVTIK